MHVEEIKSLVSKRVGFFLKDARQRAGLSIESASSHLGYQSPQTLKVYEGRGDIPCKELFRLIQRYHLPEEALSDFLIDLQVEVYKLRQK